MLRCFNANACIRKKLKGVFNMHIRVYKSKNGVNINVCIY